MKKTFYVLPITLVLTACNTTVEEGAIRVEDNSKTNTETVSAAPAPTATPLPTLEPKPLGLVAEPVARIAPTPTAAPSLAPVKLVETSVVELKPTVEPTPEPTATPKPTPHPYARYLRPKHDLMLAQKLYFMGEHTCRDIKEKITGNIAFDSRPSDGGLHKKKISPRLEIGESYIVNPVESEYQNGKLVYGTMMNSPFYSEEMKIVEEDTCKYNLPIESNLDARERCKLKFENGIEVNIDYGYGETDEQGVKTFFISRRASEIGSSYQEFRVTKYGNILSAKIGYSIEIEDTPDGFIQHCTHEVESI